MILYTEEQLLEAYEEYKKTLPENSNLLEPPFGDKYLGFIFSQGDSKEKVMDSLTLALNLANPIIK